MKDIIKKAILAIANGEQQQAADNFRKVISLKARQNLTIKEEDAEVEELEVNKEEFNFGLRDKSNIEVVRKRLKFKGLSFEEEKGDDGFTYFKFENLTDLERGKSLAERFISKTKELTKN